MYSQIAHNKRKSWFIIALFIVVIGGFGYLFSLYYGRPSFLIGALVFSVLYAGFSYFYSDKIALGLNGAKQIQKKDNPELWRTVENLCISAGMPMPSVHVINDPAPNAFATGRDPKHAAVAVTTGLMQIMDKEELEGVIAHELSHVRNYDIRVMSIVIVLVTLISVLADFFLRWGLFFGGRDRENNSGNAVGLILGIVVALIAPLVATLLKLAVSRQREYLADASGALLTRYPEGLAQALEKIGSYKQPMRHAQNATAHLFISNPLGGKKQRMSSLFSTHPPVAERVRRLRDMEDEL